MYRVLPFIKKRDILPELVRLPVELWCMILRILDPVTLLKTIQTSPLWMDVCRGDPILRKTIAEQLQLEKQKQEEAERNPALLVRVERQDSGEIFRKNQMKNVKQLKIEDNSTEEIRRVFGNEIRMKKRRGGPCRYKKDVRSQPYRNIRC